MKNAVANSVRSLDPLNCTGCGLCAHVCAFGAICLKPNKEGFLRPVVADNLCTGCGVCIKRCPPANKHPETRATPEAFAAIHKDAGVVSVSSTGGVFSALAGAVFTKGGIVFGAAFDDALRVYHIAAETAEQIAPLRGSKYLQSDTTKVFALVKGKVATGNPVLFSGTPCQTAAVRQLYARGVPDNLYLCDLLCHGVPSQKVFDAYLAGLRRQYRSAPAQVSFRDKTEGWQRFSIKIAFQNGSVYRRPGCEDPYIQGFSRNVFLRKSCHRCAFKYPFDSDLTIGDFWGAEKAGFPFDKKAGVSVVLANSPKGHALLNACPDLTLTKIPVQTAFLDNPAVTASGKPHPNRDVFLKKLNNRNFQKLHFRYINYYYEPPAKRASNAVKRWLKRRLGNKEGT